MLNAIGKNATLFLHHFQISPMLHDLSCAGMHCYVEGIQLLVLQGKECFMQLRFDRNTLSIGQGHQNEIMIPNPDIPKVAARLVFENGSHYVVDSSDGMLKINAETPPQPKTLICAGSRLTLGIHTLELISGESPTTIDEDEACIRRNLPTPIGAHGLIAHSTAMLNTFRQTERFSESDEPVLIFGASGSGKEGIARHLHAHSGRKGPFLALNCGALSSSLIESELFGHVRGAFTGATADKKGAFESAHGGTLFLDEIGELPLDLQPKLLRVLETRTVRKLGSHSETKTHARVVAATHRNLHNEVQKGRFRSDLFHRLFVLAISVPPLTQRPEDIRALSTHFLASLKSPKQLTKRAYDALMSYSWPGNVRELRNVIIRAALTSETEHIDLEDLEFLSDTFGQSETREPKPSNERTALLGALEAAGGNRAAAARSLGMSRSTFYDRVRRFGISNPFEKSS